MKKTLLGLLFIFGLYTIGVCSQFIANTSYLQSQINSISTSTGNYVVKAGDTMTGTLALPVINFTQNTGAIKMQGDTCIYIDPPACNTLFGVSISTRATYNTGMGTNALLSNSGDNNTGMGSSVLANNTTGSRNTAFGCFANILNSTGTNNTSLGMSALRLNRTGSGNIAIGYNSGYNVLGSSNIIIAQDVTSLPNNSGNYQVVIGSTNLFYGDISTGNIGLGTTSPSEKLEIVGGNIKTNYGVNAATAIINGISFADVVLSTGVINNSLNAVILSTGIIKNSLDAVILSTGTLVKKTGDTMSGTLNGTNISMTYGVSAATGVYTSSVTAYSLSATSATFTSISTTGYGINVASGAIISNGNIGISTGTPEARIAIHSSGVTTESMINIYNYTISPGYGLGIKCLASSGTMSSPSSITTGAILGGMIFSGYETITPAFRNCASIRAFAEGNFSNTSAPSYLTFDTCPSGSISRAERMRITSTGSVVVANLAGSGTRALYSDANGYLTNSASSIRYKKNVKDLYFDIDNIYKLRPVTFKWKKDNSKDFGMIAEEVYKIFPNLVFTDKEGKPEGIHYEKVCIYLIEALKSQNERIRVLENKLKIKK